MIAASVVVSALGFYGSGVSLAASKAVKHGNEEAMARDYVLAVCLIDKYAGSSIADEAEIWAQGLIASGGVSADVYARLAEIAHSSAPEPQQSRSGVRMLMQSCMALYNSPLVRTRIARTVRR